MATVTCTGGGGVGQRAIQDFVSLKWTSFDMFFFRGNNFVMWVAGGGGGSCGGVQAAILPPPPSARYI